MAQRSGLSQTAVSRIWRAFGLQPHRSETFKLSKDPLFIDKVRDIVGLYLDPPDKALVLCADEKPAEEHGECEAHPPIDCARTRVRSTAAELCDGHTASVIPTSGLPAIL
jgi:hypothetical protein